MRTQVKLWGNSLALRLPRSLADEVKIGLDTVVEVSVRKGNLVVAPVLRKKLTLKELVDGITDENRHEEITTGPSVGNEVW